MAKKILLTLGVIVVLLGVATAVFGGTVARTIAPEIFVNRMTAELRENFFLPAGAVFDGEKHLQLSVGLSSLQGEGLELTPEITSAVQLLRLRSTVAVLQDAVQTESVLQMAVSPVLTARAHFERDSLSVNVPQLFDEHIALAPDAVANDWNNSVFGDFLGQIYLLGEPYEIYSAAFDFLAEGFPVEILQEPQVEYLGRVEGEHIYRVIFSAQPGLELLFHEVDRQLRFLKFDGEQPSGTIGGHLFPLGDSRYDFVVAFENELGTLTIEGTASGEAERMNLNAGVAIETADFEAVFDVNANFLPVLSESQQEIFERPNIRHISEIGAVDIIAIAARLRELPFADFF